MGSFRKVMASKTGFSIMAMAFAMAAANIVPAQAQSDEDFVKAFAGDWQIIDSRYTDGPQPCRVELSAESTDGSHKVTKRNCAGDISKVEAWGIVAGQMVLFDKASASVATLGGNQNRMSGTGSTGAPIILERVGASGTAEALRVALKTSGCFYSGFTSDCVPASQLAGPKGESPRIEALVNLNVRSEARNDANVIGVIPRNTCVTADLCVDATDGTWCRAKFDDKTGWFRKLALRQERWPVVTFDNQCTK